MATIREFFQNLLYQVPAIGISDIVDILVVSIIFYSLLRLIRSTSAARGLARFCCCWQSRC